LPAVPSLRLPIAFLFRQLSKERLGMVEQKLKWLEQGQTK
jgi:hypothetical protein